MDKLGHLKGNANQKQGEEDENKGTDKEIDEDRIDEDQEIDGTDQDNQWGRGNGWGKDDDIYVSDMDA